MGNVGILVVLDHLSKFHFAEPIKKFTADVIVDFLEKRIFHIFGTPESVTTDNGVQFKSKLFRSLLDNYGVRHNLTAFYSPQANASERVNRTLIAAIRAYVDPQQSNWDEKLSAINCAMRSSVHASTTFSPYFVVFGQSMLNNGRNYSLLRKLDLLEEPLLDLRADEKLELVREKARENIRKAYDRNEKTYNLRARKNTFNVGDVVFYRNFALSNAANHYNAKLDRKFKKAKIVRKIGNVYFEISDMHGKAIGRYHAKDLRK